MISSIKNNSQFLVHTAYQANLSFYFEPGMIAELSPYNNECIVSDGTSPFGIFEDCHTIYKNTLINGQAKIISTPSTVLTTDQFEQDVLSAVLNTELYCSPKGKWTTIKNGNPIGYLDYIYFSTFPVTVSVVWHPCLISSVQIIPAPIISVPSNAATIYPITLPASTTTTFNANSGNISTAWLSFPFNTTCNEPKEQERPQEAQYGATCCSCKDYFPYAENKDSFKCYSCRMVW